MKAVIKYQTNSLLAICRLSEAAGGARSNCVEFFGSFCRYKKNEENGNIRAVQGNNGVAIQSTQYYPYGMTYQDRVFGQEKQPYLFNGKELDNISGLNWYDFSARYYDDVLGRFTTPDPMAEKYYSISPYAAFGNSPLRFVDPSGMSLARNQLENGNEELGMDDYTVNKNGNITLSQKTDDKTDRLIALGENGKIEYDEDGKMTNASYEVKKGILDNQKRLGKTTYMSVRGNEQAEGMFRFLSENTDVEWGRLSYGKSSNYISTDNFSLNNGIETITYDKLLTQGKGNLINSIDHSHPNIPTVVQQPSGFPETPMPKGQTGGDKSFAVWLYKYYPLLAPNITLRVYNQGKYTQFTNKSIIKK